MYTISFIFSLLLIAQVKCSDDDDIGAIKKELAALQEKVKRIDALQQKINELKMELEAQKVQSKKWFHIGQAPQRITTRNL